MYTPDPGIVHDVLATVNEIPRAFFRASAVAEKLFADLGVSAPERGVLRELFVDGEATAPEIARRKPVTRQSIQPMLDSLLAKGLVRTSENPRHKRSALYALTPAGIDCCVELQRREIAVITAILGDIDGSDFAAAARALQLMNARLGQHLDCGDDDFAIVCPLPACEPSDDALAKPRLAAAAIAPR